MPEHRERSRRADDADDARVLRLAGAVLGTIPMASLASMTIARCVVASVDMRLLLALVAFVPLWLGFALASAFVRSGRALWSAAAFSALVVVTWAELR